jgi:WD40 repeat protein
VTVSIFQLCANGCTKPGNATGAKFRSTTTLNAPIVINCYLPLITRGPATFAPCPKYRPGYVNRIRWKNRSLGKDQRMKRLFNSKVYKAAPREGGHGAPSSPFRSLFLRTIKPPHTMNRYHLQYTIQSPRGSVGTMEFSPSGRFLVVGGGHPARLRVLDRLAGFSPMIEADAISQPASLAFESSTTFIAGLDDGRFVKYTIDLKSKRLVKEWTNNSLRGPASSVTAIALDGTSEILALAVGPSVFVFIRVPETGEVPHRLLLSRLTPSRRVPVHGQHI